MARILIFLINRINTTTSSRSAYEIYGMSVALAISAVLLTLAIPGLDSRAPLFLSLTAVMLASWLGGLWPGMATAVIAVVGVNYLVLPPHGEFVLMYGPTFRFLCLSAVVSILNEALLRSLAHQVDLLSRVRSAEERYKALFDGSADAILVSDGSQHFLDANPAAVRLLGYDRSTLLTMELGDIVPAASARKTTEFAAFPTGTLWLDEISLRRRDGSNIPVEASATAVDLPTGKVHIYSIRDVTERLAAQTQQQVFIESVSHDLKNPLASVKLHIQLLQKRIRAERFDVERFAASLETVNRATIRIAVQLNELQDVARLRSGQQLDLQLEAINLVALARDSATDAQAVTSHHEIDLTSTSPSIVGRWDPLRLRRAIDNLLMNAIKYSPDGGRIVLSLETRGSDAVLSIKDEGTGIPAQDLPFIFERYHRGSNIGDRISGAGIGLAGVRQIVEGHGGRVEVESVEGTGSCFRLVLPLDFPASQHPAGAKPDQPVVLPDDDEIEPPFPAIRTRTG